VLVWSSREGEAGNGTDELLVLFEERGLSPSPALNHTQRTHHTRAYIATTISRPSRSGHTLPIPRRARAPPFVVPPPRLHLSALRDATALSLPRHQPNPRPRRTRTALARASTAPRPRQGRHPARASSKGRPPPPPPLPSARARERRLAPPSPQTNPSTWTRTPRTAPPQQREGPSQTLQAPRSPSSKRTTR
jgi:hypothetical protein